MTYMVQRAQGIVGLGSVGSKVPGRGDPESYRNGVWARVSGNGEVGVRLVWELIEGWESGADRSLFPACSGLWAL